MAKDAERIAALKEGTSYRVCIEALSDGIPD